MGKTGSEPGVKSGATHLGCRCHPPSGGHRVAIAAPSGDVATKGNGEPTRKSLPETLKEKAIQAVDAITSEKLERASPQACAIVADRLLARADAMEKQGHDMEFPATIAKTYDIASSHAVSRLTLEHKVTIENHKTQQDPPGPSQIPRLG